LIAIASDSFFTFFALPFIFANSALNSGSLKSNFIFQNSSGLKALISRSFSTIILTATL